MLKRIIPFALLVVILAVSIFLGMRLFGLDIASLFGAGVQDDYHNAGLEYKFDSLDAKLKPILDNYLLSYDYSTKPGAWAYQKYYSLDNFNLILLVFDNSKKNMDGVYLVSKADANFGLNLADVQGLSQTVTRARAYRLLDKAFVKRLIKSRKESGDFGLYSEGKQKYMYFFEDKSFFERELSAFDINQEVGYFAHEGFHFTSQNKFKRPKHISGSFRFSLPDDYPADPSSFSLIAAGFKLYEDILFDENIDLTKYAKFYDVLFKKLLELDHSGKDYINDFFLFETWLEGSAEFVESKINIGSGVFDKTDELIQYVNSYQRFVDGVDGAIKRGVTSSYVNNVETIVRYGDVLDSSYYNLGSGCLFVLDGLGVDVMSELKKGLTPYQILENYLEDNRISFDEEAVYNELKQKIDWQASLERMKSYIELFK